MYIYIYVYIYIHINMEIEKKVTIPHASSELISIN